MTTSRLLSLLALVAGAGLTQAATHLPSAIALPGRCETLVNLQHSFPPSSGSAWGWYSGSLDTTACPGGGAIHPASGPEARKILGYDGMGAALTVDLRPTQATLLIYILNTDHTLTIKDMNGHVVGTGTW
ncbi:hypothetical protein KAK06_15125 [Ideonella sp. 4Y11]|uniref:Uncharacterized protein n=1 Tax=Ideonella aquatica TaxID=2824119 RepID=A0A941BRE4_9BURK|nr:hypothetical protein [Ideonella aquatica]MBQ0960285.1 hypothetical protein [Ideonella aquatica]